VSTRTDSPFLVVGAGIAGLSTALRLAEKNRRVDVLFRGEIAWSASCQAQGGIAAALAANDSTELHVADTLNAGAGLCHQDAVSRIISNGPAAIHWLDSLGVAFTKDQEGHYHLTREGGHGRRRVVHADDATGLAVMRVLIEKVRQNPLIRLLGHRSVFGLEVAGRRGINSTVRCIGVKAANTKDGCIEVHRGRSVILATGGAAGVYQHATSGATGDGIAMAWRAGCRVANMEFMQFHPTCLALPPRSVSEDVGQNSFRGTGRITPLISEAVRGEGGVLLLPDGSRFMDRYDSRAELAPRDIVSRAIVSEMKRLNAPHVLLDISHQPAETINRHFPNISATCQKYGIDMTAEPIPVVPAAHYTCGGIVVDVNGQTDIPGLWAVGECSFTGLHGANRLASNSLLEGLVQADIISGKLAALEATAAPPTLTLVENLEPVSDDLYAAIQSCTEDVKKLVWTHAGIERSTTGLRTAEIELAELMRNASRSIRDDSHGQEFGGLEQARLMNVLTMALLITRSALSRKESRGTHLNTDYPGSDAHPGDTILSHWREAAIKQRRRA
jgi:L-aspartate oxidase